MKLLTYTGSDGHIGIHKSNFIKFLEYSEIIDLDGLKVFKVNEVFYYSQVQLCEIREAAHYLMVLLAPRDFGQIAVTEPWHGNHKVCDYLIPLSYFDLFSKSSKKEIVVKPCYTYFISDNDGEAVKIGKAIDVSERLKSLQTGAKSKLRVVKILNSNREAELHKKFKHLKLHGEWFKFTKEIKDFLETA